MSQVLFLISLDRGGPQKNLDLKIKLDEKKTNRYSFTRKDKKMSKAIVIVESPTKVKTINKFLGRKFKVVSSMGHLIDLPKSTLGVDLEDKFTPKFIVVRSKQKILSKLKKVTFLSN